MKIYHNPRCTKSRQALQLLQEKGIEPEVVEYLKNPLTEEELWDVLNKLDMEPLELVRTKEAEWIEHFKGKDLDENEIVFAMIEYPKLMERPIIVNGEKAVVARPTEKVNEVL